MNSFDHDLWVPIVFFLSIAFTFSIALVYRAKHREQIQITVRQAIDKGQELTPELLDRLGQTGAGRRSDLRRGVISVSVGVGIASFGLILGEDDATRPLMAVGAVPLLVGLAYLGLWKFTERSR